jgi:hypothetical protein
MLTFSICLTDLPKEKITTGKNGKKYINLVSLPNYNGEVDKFGNTHNITVSQTKEERAAKQKRVFVGNGKEWASKDVVGTSESFKAQEPASKPSTFTDTSDDLPF